MLFICIHSDNLPLRLTYILDIMILEKIDFGNNAIVGSIPDNIDSLENLGKNYRKNVIFFDKILLHLNLMTKPQIDYQKFCY